MNSPSVLLLDQIRRLTDTGTDREAATRWAILTFAHRLTLLSGDRAAIREIAADLREHAGEIAEFCTRK